MVKGFLLRFQEHYICSNEDVPLLGEATGTKIPGESPDWSITSSSAFALPKMDPTVSFAPVARSDEANHLDNTPSAIILSHKSAIASKKTLTYTFVDSEAPKNDDNRKTAGRVLPLCC